jgi:eukaryotic-like serine/threonine-protein kinase
MAADRDAIAIGTHIGPYEIVGEIGSGGMGRVFLATDHSLAERKVVIKTIRAVAGVDDEALEARFTREARSLARLHHEHVISLFAAGVHKGLPYLVMEYCPGRDLAGYVEEAALLAEHERQVRLVRAIAQVARGIEHAHSRGVVHRDLKPANILIRAEDDGAVVLDFGIARAAGEVALTVGLQMPGTLAYEAPEQLDSGLRRRDELIDVWAMGVILYRVLTGQHPFHGDDTASLSTQILTVNPPRPRELSPRIPAALDELVMACLEREPWARPASATEVASRLEDWLAETTAPPVRVAPPPEPTTAPQRTLAATVRSQARPRFARSAVPIAVIAVAIGAVAGIAPVKEHAIALWRTLSSFDPNQAATITADPGMVIVPEGTAVIGCPAAAGVDCGKPAEAVATVELATFEIDRTPVTVADYARCVRNDHCSANGLRIPFFRGEAQPEVAKFCNWDVAGREQHPINCVSWEQARQFCHWAGKRLPTGAEWEKAARGSDGRLYPWGNTGFGAGPPRANIADESARGLVRARRIRPGYNDGYAGTSPVGNYPDGASPYDALDMVGNVWQWVADEQDGEHESRGASWASDASAANAAHRRLLAGEHRSANGGFRCARDEGERARNRAETVASIPDQTTAPISRR